MERRHEEVARLLAEYRQSRAPELKERITRAYLDSASYVARKFSGRGVEYDDLFQVASFALAKAIDRYDPDKGARFITFATPAMVGEVKNYFRDKSRLINLPRSGSEMIRRLRASCDELYARLGRMPTPVELAEAMDSPVETVLEVMEMQHMASPVSLDATPAGEEGSPLEDFLGREEPGYGVFEDRDLVHSLLARLPGEERDLLAMRYTEGLTQREAAERLGVSQMTVSRTERRVLEKIREWMKEEQ